MWSQKDKIYGGFSPAILDSDKENEGNYLFDANSVFQTSGYTESGNFGKCNLLNKSDKIVKQLCILKTPM